MDNTRYCVSIYSYVTKTKDKKFYDSLEDVEAIFKFWLDNKCLDKDTCISINAFTKKDEKAMEVF